MQVDFGHYRHELWFQDWADRHLGADQYDLLLDYIYKTPQRPFEALWDMDLFREVKEEFEQSCPFRVNIVNKKLVLDIPDRDWAQAQMEWRLKR